MSGNTEAPTYSIDACDEAFVRDFCPYKGSPDPFVVWRAAWRSATAALAQQAATPPMPDVSDLLTWAVEDGVICMSKVMDADLQDALVRFAKRFPAARQAATPAPAGWKLVPVEPTEEMHAAAVRTIVRCIGNADWPPRVYRAMLAAAPPATPAAQPAEPQKHMTKENGDCPHWCKACHVEAEERAALAAPTAAQAGDALPPTDCKLCGQPWSEHEAGVPAPYCPAPQHAEAIEVLESHALALDGMSRPTPNAVTQHTADENRRKAAAIRATIAALAARGAQAGDEREAFRAALKQTWQMIDPRHPAGQPGSYARGEYNGIVAALQTVRENFDRAARAALKGQPEGQA